MSRAQCVHVSSSKAIRDGKYLARHMPVPGNVHPIKIQTFDVSSLRHFSARSRFYILINMAAQKVRSQEKHLKEIVGPVFEIYAIELLGSMLLTRHDVIYVRYIFIRSALTYRECLCKSL